MLQYGQNADFYFIIGEDSFAMFDQWVHPERICAVCKIVVAKRPLDKAAIKKAHPMAFNERIEAYRQKFSTEFIEMPGRGDGYFFFLYPQMSASRGNGNDFIHATGCGAFLYC